MDVASLPSLSVEALKKSWQALRDEQDCWVMLQRLLAAAGDSTPCPPPEHLHKAIELVDELLALVDDMESLQAADFRDPDLGSRVASVRARVIRMTVTNSFLNLEAVVDVLEHIESACKVRDGWQEFDRVCTLMSRGESPLDGTNERIRHLIAEIGDVLRQEAVENWSGGVRLAGDLARHLADANPALPLAHGVTAIDDILGFADRLCQEEQNVRARLVAIEQVVPRGSLGDPNDQRYDCFFELLPNQPPVGRIAQRIYHEFMRREPMPTIVRQAQHRLPQWLTVTQPAEPSRLRDQ